MKKDTVQVLYKYVDGAHFFVSDDEETLGLCVAHKDPMIAFNSVSKQLGVLFQENYGIKTEFEPSISVQMFLNWFLTATDAALSGPVPGVAGKKKGER